MDVHIDCETLRNLSDEVFLKSVTVCDTEVFIVIWKDMRINVALVSNQDMSKAAIVCALSATDNLTEVDAIVNDLISKFESKFCFCNKR